MARQGRVTRVSAETNQDDAQLLKAWDPQTLNSSREEH